VEFGVRYFAVRIAICCWTKKVAKIWMAFAMDSRGLHSLHVAEQNYLPQLADSAPMLCWDSIESGREP
jgi:hypothetical protein